MPRPAVTAVILGGVALSLGAGLGLWLLAPAAPVPREPGPTRGDTMNRGSGVDDGSLVLPGAHLRGEGTGGIRRIPGAPVEIGDDDHPDDEEDLVGGEATYGEILKAVEEGNWLLVESLMRRGGSTDPRITELLLKHLSDGRWRNFAAGLFEFVKDPDALRRLLEITRGDAPESTRLAALLASSRIGGPEVTAEALRMFREAADGSQMAATAPLALARDGSADAARLLLDLLREKGQSGSRYGLVAALGEIRSPEGLAAMTALLGEEGADAQFQMSLLQALGRTKEPGIAEEVAKFARETTDPDLRREAWKALGQVGGDAALRGILEGFSSADPADHLAAAVALQGVKDPGAAAAVARLLQTSTDPVVRQYLATSLGRMDAPEAEAALVALAKDATADPGLRTVAVRELGRLGKPSSVEAILDAYENAAADDSAMRRIAIEAVRAVGDPAALPRLKKILAGAKQGSTEWLLLTTAVEQLERDLELGKRRGREIAPVGVPPAPAGETPGRDDAR